ncbi:MAG: GNAT family N-acetyltransferase [Cellulomonas sp.]|nr:GNAT family N-acetyltransferase [Cellulomonas sp.]
MRSGSNIRPVVTDDLPQLVDLCLVARDEAGTGSALCTDDVERLTGQLATALMLPGSIMLVALHEGEPEGILLARLVGPSPFSDVVAVDLEALYVGRDSRRRGVGHALLAGLLELAEQHGATEIYASPLPGARGVQRFLARLGFQPAASHRVVSTAALQRRLVADEVAPRSGAVRRVPMHGVDRLIALRRKSRTEPSTGELPVQPAEPTSMHVRRDVQMRRPSASSTTIS